MASQSYVVEDRPDGRVFNYTPASLTAPTTERVSTHYAPPDHDQARGWAFDAALEATIRATLTGLLTAGVGAGIAARLGLGVGGIALGGLIGIVGAFVWHSPTRAFRQTRDAWEQVALDYHDAAIERLRNRPPVAPPVAPLAPRIERTAPDAGEMFYLQCAAVLARATVDPSAPRRASEKIQTVTRDGVLVVVTKDEYKNVAGMLCELGFMTGGAGQDPPAYAIAPQWQDMDVADLLRALKPHKATIRAKVTP